MKNNIQTKKCAIASAKLKNKTPFKKFHSDTQKNSRIFFAIAKSLNEAQVVEQTLEDVKNTASNTPKAKKKKIFNIVFFLVNILLVALVFYNFAHEQGGVQPLSTLFANKPKWTYIFIGVGLYFATVIFNILKFLILIYSKTKKFRPWFSLKLATIGRYYDLITPLGSGGQPFEIYYLKKDGYSGDIATAIPLAKYMIWQVSFMLLSLGVLIAYSCNYVSSTLVLVLAWVALSITLLLFLFVFFMSITKKWGASLVVRCLKLLYKMKIIKNYRLTLQKVLRFVKSYQYSFKALAKSPLTVISGVIVTTLSTLSNALIAYFIYSSFVTIPEISWLDMICKCIICELVASIMPLPGGSGASELSFNALLGALFPAGTLFWGILIWRICTYYLYIGQGLIVLVIDMFTGKRKKSVKETKNQLEEQNT